MNLYKKFTTKLFSVLVINTTFASGLPLRFRRNLLGIKLWKISMTTDEKIADEQLQYRIYKEAAKISALSSGKIDKYEYLKGQELLPTD